MNKLTIKAKFEHFYKLIKDDKTNETANDDKTTESFNGKTNETAEDDQTNESTNDKPLNQLFRRKRELFKFYNITSFSSNCIIKSTRAN